MLSPPLARRTSPAWPQCGKVTPTTRFASDAVARPYLVSPNVSRFCASFDHERLRVRHVSLRTLKQETTRSMALRSARGNNLVGMLVSISGGFMPLTSGEHLHHLILDFILMLLDTRLHATFWRSSLSAKFGRKHSETYSSSKSSQAWSLHTLRYPR